MRHIQLSRSQLYRSVFLIRQTLALATLLLLTACQAPSPLAELRPSPAQHAIASAHPLATQAGLDMLAQGGNAFDAAVAVAATLAVVEPYSAGMGGGGFWLLHDATRQRDIFIDAREKAPLSAHRDMYLDEKGEIQREASINGPRAAGIPGQAAAFAHLARQYGKLPLNLTLAPAIQLARDGFPAHRVYLDMLQVRQYNLARYAESRRIFLNNGAPVREGTLIRQPELANTLRALARLGHEGFYSGAVATTLVNGVNAAGGQWSLDDLKQYDVVEREPLRFDTTITIRQGGIPVHASLITAPPPSSGGVVLAEMFNMLEHFPWPSLQPPDQIHLMSEVMRRAYRDRAEYLGDPDFVDMPLSVLLSKQHADELARGIRMNQATGSAALGRMLAYSSGTHTTHFSIMDAQGNSVAATLSINLPFGSAFTVPGTGVLLNNEMDDFSAKVGTPNAYGLVGSEANAIAPGKRPLSSMTPTFMAFERDGKQAFAVLGTPGGSRIISMVFFGLQEAMQGAPVEQWVNRPRYHHQYLPDEIQHEPGALDAATQTHLKSLGHQLTNTGRPYGNMQALLLQRDSGALTAASDKRGIGAAIVVPADTDQTQPAQLSDEQRQPTTP